MSAIVKSEVLDPHELTLAQRQALIDALYAIHCQIFDGVDKNSFAKYVVESKATHTTIHVHKNAIGEIVGYFAVHVFEKELSGKPVAVFRAEAGNLREYRGNNSNIGRIIPYVLRYRLAHPNQPIFYLGTLVHPSSYMLLERYADLVWPNREQPLSLEIKDFLAELAHAFGLDAVHPSNPLVVHVGWRTRDTEVERDYWCNSDKPAAQFFIQENPNYGEGHGLMTMVPVNNGGILRAAGRLMGGQIQRRTEGLRTLIRQAPLARMMIGVSEIRQRLQHTRLFAEVADDDLTEVARAASVTTLPAGRFVIRQGEASADLYLVASGSVVVLVEREGEQKVIDQLWPGEMFGEIAMLSGEPRTASVRTAARTTLIQVKREALLSLMNTHARMREVVWGAFARRRFDTIAGNSTRFGSLTRQQRREWFVQGRLHHLTKGERITVADPWLFILTGTVEMQQGASWFTVRAPALIQVTDSVDIGAQNPSQCVCLPEVSS